MTQIRAQEPELDCSDGARMLIERMQTNPEDFSYGGKLYRAVESERMSTRDMKAYNDAHDLYIKEPNLMASVLQALLAQPEKEEEIGLVKFKAQGRYAFGATDPQAHGSPIQIGLANQQRITREMYEDHIQTHKSPIKKHIDAVRAEKESIAAQIYNKAFGRERVERDN